MTKVQNDLQLCMSEEANPTPKKSKLSVVAIEQSYLEL